MRGLKNIFGLHWFYSDFWNWLFSDLRGFDDTWYWSLKVLWCRMRHHPYGIVYYSSDFEPDTHCKNCGDETER